MTLFSVMFLKSFSQATVAGSTGADGTYANLRLAFAAINAQGAQGGNNIVITITTSITDNASAVLNQPGTSSWTSLTIYPTATGYTLSGSVASPLIDFNGADNVTLDGRVNASGTTEDLVIKNTNTSSGAGTVLFRNDATSNIVKYSKIFSYNSNAGSTSDGAIIFSTTTGSSGNNNNEISNCYIGTDDNTKLVGNAILSNGTASKSNSANTITNCRIFDFKMVGIYCAANTNSFSITNNSFYQSTAFTPAAKVYMVYLTSGGGYTITGNYFGGQDALCAGATPFTLNTSAYTFSVVTSGTSTSGGTITISGNTIKNISVTTTNSTAGEAAFSGFSLFGSCNYIIGSSGNGNQFGETSGATASIIVAANNTSLSPFQGIYTSTSITTQTVSVAYNTFGAISITSTSTPASIYFIGTVATANYYSSVTIDHNTIGNTTSNNIVYGIKNVFYGISTQATTSPTTCTITNNTLQGINFNAAVNDNNSGNLIYFNSTTGKSCTVTDNVINDISISTAGSASNVNWRFLKSSTGSGTLVVSSNTISNITQSATTKCWVSFIELDNSGTLTCNGNTIGASSPANNLSLASANYHQGIYLGYQGTFTVNNNVIQQINQTSSSSGASFQPIKIDYGSSSTATLPSASLNQIKDITCSGTSTADPFYGVYFRGTTADINTNTIQNITTSTKFYGVFIHSGSATTVSITDNSFTNLTQTGASTFSGIDAGASTSITITGNIINDISFTSTSTSVPLFTAINTSGAASITIGTQSSPNTIGSTSGVWSSSDGISIADNSANSGSQGSFSLIKIAGTSGAVNVGYNTMGGVKVSGSNTSGKICLVENLCSVDATIDNNTFGNGAADNMDIIAGMKEEWITDYSTTSDRNVSSITQTITNNTFQNFKISTVSAVPIYGILNELGLNQTVSNGGVQYSLLVCTGNVFSNISSTATSSFKLISNGNTVYNRAGNFDISGNSISNITISGATSIYFIYVDSRVGPATINSNLIGGSSSNNISIAANCSTFGIYFTDSYTPAGANTYTFSSNNIRQFNLTNTGTSNKFYGIYFGPSSGNPQYCAITNNSIANITSASKYASTTAPSVSALNFLCTNGTSSDNSITGNTINDLSLTDNTAINNLISGIFFGDAGASFNLKQNHIYSISNLSTGGSGIIAGVFQYNNSASISNNFKYHNNAMVLDNSTNTNSVSMYGIYSYWGSGATNGAPELYHNTIKMAGTSGGSTTSSSYYLNNSDGSAFNVKNNIFQNKRTGGSGFNYAFQQVKSSPVGTWDYNYLEVSDNVNKCVHWGAAGAAQDYSFAGWQAIPKGANDINGTITIAPAGNVPSATTADVKSNGINTTGITVDIDGVSRASGTVAIPCGSCNGPWRGAYESNAPLQVDLISFNAILKENKIFISWSTASEINSDYFLLLKSADLKTYFTIDSMSASGNSSTINYYRFIDENPLAGINYFKLIQVDVNGSFQQFNPISVSYSIESGIIAFPNSDFSQFAIFTPAGHKNLSIVLHDITGRGAVEKNVRNSDTVLTLELPPLPPGIFLLSISAGSDCVFKRKYIKL